MLNNKRMDYGGFLYLNPEIVLSGNIGDVDSAKAFLDAHVANGGALTDFHSDRSLVPPGFDGNVYLAGVGITANVSRLNRAVVDLMKRNGWSDSQVASTSEYVRNIDRPAAFDGVDTFTIPDPFTDLAVSTGDLVRIVVDGFAYFTGKARTVDYTARTLAITFDVGRTPPSSATEYVVTGVAVVDPDRIGAVNYVRGAHVASPPTSVPDWFNLDLYHLLYPETRLMGAADAYANYVSHNNQYKHQAGTVSDIRLAAGQLVVRGDSAFFGDIVITQDLEVNAPSTFNDIVFMNADVQSSCNVASASLDTSNLIVHETATVKGEASFCNNVAITSNLDVIGTASFCNNVAVTSNLDVMGTASFYDSLAISSNLDVLGTASFCNNVTITSNLDVLGTASFYDSLAISSNLDVLGTASFCNNVTITSNLDVLGTASFYDSLAISSNLEVLGTASFCNNATISSNLDVLGTASFHDSLALSSNLDVLGTASFCNNATISSNLAVLGTASFCNNATISSNLAVLGTASFCNNATISSNLAVLGTASFCNNATISSKLEVLGTASFCNNATISSNLDVLGTASFCNNATISSNLDVLGTASFCNNATISSNLAVLGTASFCNNATISSNLDVLGTASFCNNVAVKSNLEVLGTASFHDSLALSSNLEVLGTASFCNNATISSNLEVLGTASFYDSLALSSNLAVLGTAFFCNNATISSNFDVLGTASFSNRVAITSNLDVLGTAFFSSNVGVLGAAEFLAPAKFSAHATFATVHAHGISGSNLSFSNVDALTCSASSLSATGSFACLGPGTFSNNVKILGSLDQSAGAFFGSAVSIKGELAASNEVSIRGTLTCNSNVIVSEIAHFDDDLTVSGKATFSGVAVSGAFSVGSNSRFAGDVEALARFTVAGDAGFAGSNDFAGALVVSGPLLEIPRGPTSARPVPANPGAIRYNTDLRTFEGMSSSSTWTSLGGVVDSDRDTFVSAEDTNEVKITTSGAERVVVTGAGDIGIGVSAPSCKLHVDGFACFSNLGITGFSNLAGVLSGLSNVVGGAGAYVDPPFVLATATVSTSNVAELSSAVEIDETDTLSDVFTVRAFAAPIATPGLSNHVQFSRFVRKVRRHGDDSGLFEGFVAESGLATTSLSNILLTKAYDTSDFAAAPCNLLPEKLYRVQVMVENSLGYKTVLTNHENLISNVVETDDVFAPTFTTSNVVALSDSNVRIDVGGISDVGVGKTVAYAIATDPGHAFTPSEIDDLAVANSEGQCNADVSFVVSEYFDQARTPSNMENYSLYNAHVVVYDVANPANKTIRQIGSVRTFDRLPPTHDSTNAPRPVPGALEMTVCNIQDDTPVSLFPLGLPDGSNTTAPAALAAVRALAVPAIPASLNTSFAISNYLDANGALAPLAEYTPYNAVAVLEDASNNATLVTFTATTTLDESPPTIVSGALAAKQLPSKEILVDGADLRDPFSTFDLYLFAFDASPVPDSNLIMSRILSNTYTQIHGVDTFVSSGADESVSLATDTVLSTESSPSTVPLTDKLVVYPVVFVHDREVRNGYGGNFASFAAPPVTIDLAPPNVSLAILPSFDPQGNPVVSVLHDAGDAVRAKVLLADTPVPPPASALALLADPAGVSVIGTGTVSSNAVENTDYYAWIAAEDALSNVGIAGPCNVFVPGVLPVVTSLSTSLDFDNTVEVTVNATDKGRAGLSHALLEFSSNATPSNLMGGVRLSMDGDSHSAFFTTGILDQGVAYYFHAAAVDARGNMSHSNTKLLEDNGGFTYYLSGPTFDSLGGTSNFKSDAVFFTYEVSHFLPVTSIKAVLASSNQDSNVVDATGVAFASSNSNGVLVPPTSAGWGLSNITTTGALLDPSTRYSISLFTDDTMGNATLEHLPIFTLDDQPPTVDSLSVSHTPPSNVAVSFGASDSFDGVLTRVHVLVSGGPFAGDVIKEPGTYSVGASGSNFNDVVHATADPHLDTYVYVVAEDNASALGSPSNLLSATAVNVTLAPTVALAPTFSHIATAPTTNSSFTVLTGSGTAGEVIEARGGGVATEADEFTAFLVMFRPDKVPVSLPALSNVLTANPHAASKSVVGQLLSFATARATAPIEQHAINVAYSLDGSAAVAGVLTLVSRESNNATTPADVRASGTEHGSAHAGTLRLEHDGSGANLDHSSRYKITILVEDADGNETVTEINAVTLDATKPVIDEFTVAHTGVETVNISAEASDAFDGSVSNIYYHAAGSDIDPADLPSRGNFVTGGSLDVSISIPAHCNSYVRVQAEDTASSFGNTANILSDVASIVTLVPDIVSPEQIYFDLESYEFRRDPGLVRADAAPLKAYLTVFPVGSEPTDAASLSNAIAGSASPPAPVAVVDETISISSLTQQGVYEDSAVNLDFDLGGTATPLSVGTHVVKRGETFDPESVVYAPHPNAVPSSGRSGSLRASLVDNLSAMTPSTLYTVAVRAEDEYGAIVTREVDAFTLDTAPPSITAINVSHPGGGSNVAVDVASADAFDGTVSAIHCIVSRSKVDATDLRGIGVTEPGSNASFAGTVPTHCNTYVYVQAEDSARDLFGNTSNNLSAIATVDVAPPEFLDASVGAIRQAKSVPLEYAVEVVQTANAVSAEVEPITVHLALFAPGTDPVDPAAVSNLVTGGVHSTSNNVFL